MRAAMLLFALSGCAALPDGRYACPDGRCPAGFSCHPDQVCRRSAPSDATIEPDVPSDAPPPDAPPGASDYYEPCTSDVDCASGRCHFGFAVPWAVGYCSEPCDRSTDCGAITREPYSNCSLAGACELYCVAAIQCPLPFRCVGSYRELPSLMTIGQCYPAGQAIAPGGATCSVDRDCAEDMDCIDVGGTTECRRPCGPGYVCAEGESCRTAGSVGTYCLP